jgi:hypothetical protein
MQVDIVSVLERFDAPIPWDRVRWLEQALVERAIKCARRDGVPRGFKIRFVQLDCDGKEGIAAAVRGAMRHNRGLSVVLTPSSKHLAEEIANELADEPCLLFHQNLAPVEVSQSRSFRMGIGTREGKHSAAAAVLAARGATNAVLVTTTVAHKGYSIVGRMGLVERIEENPSAIGELASMVQVLRVPDEPHTPDDFLSRLAGFPSDIPILLECGGPLNRAITASLGGSRDIILLNGNPDVSDVAGNTRLVEIVGNLPDRIGGGLASAVLDCTGKADRADLDTAGMFAWRVDAVRLVAECLDGISSMPSIAPASWATHQSATADRLASSIASFDGIRRIFRGWHRPIWFDSLRCNACIETVTAHVDSATGRRVINPAQAALGPNGSWRSIAVMAVDVDFIEAGSINEDAGTFVAEALVGIECCGESLDAGQSASLRVLNAVGEPEWIAVEPSVGARRLFILRGTFRFDPELAAYPFDTQLLTVRLAGSGHATDALLSPVPGLSDIQCAIPGWRVESGHRGVYVQARSSMGCAPKVQHGIEFGIRSRRARRDVQYRVALPLALLSLVATSSVIAGHAGHLEMTAGLLGSVFLSAVALYFAEPKPSPGARTLIDVVYLRAFLLFGGMLIGVLLCMRLPEPQRAWLLVGIGVSALPAAWLLVLVPLSPAASRRSIGG